MSKWSGCCDLADTLEIHEYTLEELQNNVKIYVGDDREPLHIEKMSDMIPYYPYIVSSAGFNNADRTATIFLSSKSQVDREEQEYLEWRLERLLKIYNRCKKKKIEFNVDEVAKVMILDGWNEGAYRELVNRVKLYGKKATTNGIHLRTHEYYRKLLVEEMIKNGLNPCNYGDYERFISKEV